MSESVNVESVESTESVEESAPKFDFAMVALKSRFNFANPTKNADFEIGNTVYVTENKKGAYRAALSIHDIGLSVDDVKTFDHATRKGSYGELKIVGMLNSFGELEGFIPTASLSLREIV